MLARPLAKFTIRLGVRAGGAVIGSRSESISVGTVITSFPADFTVSVRCDGSRRRRRMAQRRSCPEHDEHDRSASRAGCAAVTIAMMPSTRAVIPSNPSRTIGVVTPFSISSTLAPSGQLTAPIASIVTAAQRLLPGTTSPGRSRCRRGRRAPPGPLRRDLSASTSWWPPFLVGSIRLGLSRGIGVCADCDRGRRVRRGASREGRPGAAAC